VPPTGVTSRSQRLGSSANGHGLIEETGHLHLSSVYEQTAAIKHITGGIDSITVRYTPAIEMPPTISHMSNNNRARDLISLATLCGNSGSSVQAVELFQNAFQLNSVSLDLQVVHSYKLALQGAAKSYHSHGDWASTTRVYDELLSERYFRINPRELSEFQEVRSRATTRQAASHLPARTSLINS